MPGPRAGKSDTWLQIFQNDSKICEAEVTLTPLTNKICKPWKNFVFNEEITSKMQPSTAGIANFID